MNQPKDERATTLVFDLPIPPRGTARNVAASTHWRVRHKATKEYHSHVQIIGKQVMFQEGYLPKGVNEQYRGQITTKGVKQIVTKVRTVYRSRISPEHATTSPTDAVVPSGSTSASCSERSRPF